MYLCHLSSALLSIAYIDTLRSLRSDTLPQTTVMLTGFGRISSQVTVKIGGLGSLPREYAIDCLCPQDASKLLHYVTVTSLIERS